MTEMTKEQEEMEQKKDNKEEEINWKVEMFVWARYFIIMFLCMFLLTRFVVFNAYIPSCSMENQLQIKDRLIGNRLAYLSSDPQRLDVVIFRYPVNEKETFIKRIIGLPGETVEITDGKIYIDHATEPLDEPYLKEKWVSDNDGFVFHVPKDSYLMLGDNRNRSLDARGWPGKAVEFGKAKNLQEGEKFRYVKRDKILAKAVFKYWRKPGWIS